MISKTCIKVFIGEGRDGNIPLIALSDGDIVEDPFKGLVVGSEAYTLSELEFVEEYILKDKTCTALGQKVSRLHNVVGKSLYGFLVEMGHLGELFVVVPVCPNTQQIVYSEDSLP